MHQLRNVLAAGDTSALDPAGDADKIEREAARMPAAAAGGNDEDLGRAACRGFAIVLDPGERRRLPGAETRRLGRQGFQVPHRRVIPDLKLHYTTVGEPTGQPVLVLHGTGGSGASMLTPAFAGELFGAGQPLDASKYYIIIPDAIGHGKSSKPSDGMKTSFPKYNYNDMVEAQHRLVTEGLGVKHLRLVIGNSMGGMQTWLWGETYPKDMDALVPMASQPTEMASRNWMTRRIMLDTIRNDPDYNGGNYTSQPRMMKYAITAYGIASIGGTLAYQQQAPTAAKADKIVDERLATPITANANDFVYQWDSSHDYNAAEKLEGIGASLLLINSADDERNPPETGVTDAAMKRVKNGKLYLIPASTETRGHGTTGNAKFYSEQVRQLLQTAPQRTM